MMKKTGLFFLFLVSTALAQNTFWGQLVPGSHAIGFQLITLKDLSRSYGTASDRDVRIYFWYPCSNSEGNVLSYQDVLSMTADDFNLSYDGHGTPATAPPLPVPLVKGLSARSLDVLMTSMTVSAMAAKPAEGSFPLILMGQGLYYESPFSQWILAEYLASHGYCVATCPLKGSQHRLVNLNVQDLETLVRDLEVVSAHVKPFPVVNSDRMGVIGYDMGGMAGLTFVMRHPEVKVFVSLDAGILYGHASTLPDSHPSYHENRFAIPWMHITQHRFAAQTGSPEAALSLMERRPAGEGTLLLVDTQNHGQFTSYAMYGMELGAQGYWAPVDNDAAQVYETVCRSTELFLDRHLYGLFEAQSALETLDAEHGLVVSLKKYGMASTATEPALVIHRIIENGAAENQSYIEDLGRQENLISFVNENELNWLGYHFLYWWGRQKEAVLVFRLMTQVYPQSANAYDSLGEACLTIGDYDEALQQYRRSLELNPENENAKNMIAEIEKALHSP